MNQDHTFLVGLGQAAGLGFGLVAILWLLRRFSFIKRVSMSLLGAAIAVGVNIVLRAAAVPDDDIYVKIFTSAAVMLVANAALQVINLAIWEFLFGKLRRIIVPRLLVDLFNAIVLAGVALALLDRVFAVDLTAVLVTSTVVSAVIGLSLQDTLGNVIAGLALQLDRPFEKSDWLNIGEQHGEVIEMSWRTITLRSLDNHQYIIPNANVARHYIVNYSRPTRVQRLHLNVGLSYNYPPGEAKRVLAQAVARVNGVRKDPPPDVLLLEYGESSINYDVRYWIDNYKQQAEIRDAVLTRIWYAIRRAGMSVPFPTRDLNVRQVAEDHELQIQQQLRLEIREQLRPLAVFAPLSDQQIERLAQCAAVHQYADGELLVEQGDKGDSLFVIKTGQAKVDVTDTDGRVTTVARLGPTEFFGEMSLLTGERRSASVVAERETEVVVLDKSGLAKVLAADMATLEALSQVVEQRLQDSAEKVAAAAAAQPGEDRNTGSTLLARIQGFLGLK